jgi:hypothetical protein
VLTERIARYVLGLEECASKTKRAEDRGIYQLYLADAAVLLAMAVAGQANAVRGRLEAHERLWGHTWPQDEVYRIAQKRWAEVKHAFDQAT